MTPIFTMIPTPCGNWMVIRFPVVTHTLLWKCQLSTFGEIVSHQDLRQVSRDGNTHAFQTKQTAPRFSLQFCLPLALVQSTSLVLFLSPFSSCAHNLAFREEPVPRRLHRRLEPSMRGRGEEALVTSTLELQLASFDMCSACRGVTTLHVRVEDLRHVGCYRTRAIRRFASRAGCRRCGLLV